MKRYKGVELSYIEFLETARVIRMLYNKEVAKDFFVKNSRNFGIDMEKSIQTDDEGKYFYIMTSKA